MKLILLGAAGSGKGTMAKKSQPTLAFLKFPQGICLERLQKKAASLASKCKA